MRRRRLVLSLLVLVALAVIPAGGAAASGAGSDRLSRINHIVVIYQENHSFDNLYGSWEGVNGLRNAPAARTIQVNQAGTPYQCLLQNDVNLTSPPLSATCTDTTTGTTFTSHFTNQPFTSTTTSRPRPRPARRLGCRRPTASRMAAACPAAAPATWCTASTKSNTS